MALLYEDRERVDLGVYIDSKSLIDFTETELSFYVFSFIFIHGFIFLNLFLVFSLFSFPALCLHSAVIISYRGNNVILAFGRCLLLLYRQILPAETWNFVLGLAVAELSTQVTV